MKKLLVTLVILFFSKLLFAATATQCPDAKNISHVQGADWKLSEKAKSEGWYYATQGAKESARTTLPDNTSITILLSVLNKSAFEQCNYGDYGILMNNAGKTPDVAHVAQPPFYCFNTVCSCNEDIQHTDTCTWKWL